jgi:hypothetical protein
MCSGIGFVNFADQQSAIAAVQQLHGSRTSQGRSLCVALQAPRPHRAAAAAASAALVAAANTAPPGAYTTGGCAGGF